MNQTDFKKSGMDLKRIKQVLSLIEDEENNLHKFKNTEIYHSLKYTQKNSTKSQ